MGSKILFTIFLLPLMASTNGKTLTDCELVRELQRAGISNTYISNWVCLAQSESNADTALVTGPKTASSYSFGIFQINSTKWCTRGRIGGICNKRCEDFLNDDIQDDIVCAKKIINQVGFKAFDGWNKKCKNKSLPNIEKCL